MSHATPRRAQGTPQPRAGRHAFLRDLATAGAGLAAVMGLSSLGLPDVPGAAAAGLTAGDRAMLDAAQLAEALAVTTYAHIITHAPLFGRLFPQDQAYLQAAHQQEMAHYALLHSLTGALPPATTFFYPRGMFTTAQTTLNTLLTLEETFIAAYLVGVRTLSTPDLREAAARIMGVESDHRTMARVLAPGIDPADGGPLRSLTGIMRVVEPVDPANNNAFERTVRWTTRDHVLAALRPFMDRTAAVRAGFDSTRPYAFVPFVPTLSTSLGAY